MMIIMMSENRMKSMAKRLRKVLRDLGIEMKHVACIELAARLCGFDDRRHYLDRDLDEPLSLLNDELLEEDFAARDAFEMSVREAAGLGPVARELLDGANPTGSWAKQANDGPTFQDNSAKRGHSHSFEDDLAGHLFA
jgi:hypothetical protein